MEIQFPTDYTSIMEKVDKIDPIKYGKTRNYINGNVSYLSPYISRGVISTKQVLEHVLTKGVEIAQVESFVKELCWRDYFQRVGQTQNLNIEIKNIQQPVVNHELPESILNFQTGITGIDTSIELLYQQGYMHNHCRMYLASVVCNIAKSHWLKPAQWMYFHLLDGDWASNACSWQWVSAANSSKKYYANQENINKYTHTNQTNTFLDKSYEELEQLEIPSSLLATEKVILNTVLPETKPLIINTDTPTFIYNYYNLDPLWQSSTIGNRILLLEPEFFKQYPVSKNCIDFVLNLSKNIQNIQLYVGSFESLITTYSIQNCYYKEHPFNKGYVGKEEPRDWITDKVTGYSPSFFAYWKKVEKHINKLN